MRYSFLAALSVTLLIYSAVFAADEVQSPQKTEDSLGKTSVIVGLLSGPAFTVWFSWYTIKVWLPRERKEQRDQIEKLTASFLQHNETERQEYLTDKKEAEVRHAAQMSTVNEKTREDVRLAMQLRKEAEDNFREELKELRLQMEKNECRFHGHGMQPSTANAGS